MSGWLVKGVRIYNSWGVLKVLEKGKKILEGKNNFKKLDQFQISDEVQCRRGIRLISTSLVLRKENSLNSCLSRELTTLWDTVLLVSEVFIAGSGVPALKRMWRRRLRSFLILRISEFSHYINKIPLFRYFFECLPARVS